MHSTDVAYHSLARLKMALRSKKRTRASLAMGILATMAASLSFTFMSGCAKYLTAYGAGELTLFRGMVGLFLIPVLCLKTRERFFTGKHPFLLSLRGFFGSCGLFFYFLSLKGLTLGDSQILAQLSAFFMCFLSPIFLSERLPKGAVPGMAAIAAGTLCVVQIWNFESFNHYALYGIAGGFSSACAYTVITKLAEKNFRSNTEIVFYFQLFSMLVGIAMLDGPLLIPSGTDWFFIAGLGFFALSAQLFMTWAFQHVNSIIVSFLMYSEILFHALYGRLVWDEIMPLSSWIGGALIVLGSVMLLVLKPRPASDTHHH